MVSESSRAPPAASVDALRADLAETRLHVHDLERELEETRAALRDAERRLAAGQGSSSVDEAVARSLETQGAQRDLIERLTREVNALNAKTRMMEVRDDLQREQERELRASFDAFFFAVSLAALALSALAAAEWFGFVDVAGAYATRKLAAWSAGGHSGGGGREGECAAAAES
jgi:chromosome segregation ATPase